MAISVMPRTGHKTYSAGTDPHPNREQFNERMRLHEALVTLSSHGTPQQRPSAGSGKRFYVSVETNGQRRLYWDDGSSWQEITTNGGGGAGASIAVAAAGSEGTSLRSARADHRHPLPLATPSSPGAMSSQDKLKLNSATSTVQGSTLMERTAQGNTFVASPTASGHAVNRQYVDDVADELNGGGGAGRGMAIEGEATAVEGTSLYNARADHTHLLRLARTTEPGAMSASDKTKLNASTFERLPGTLAQRASNGAIQVNTGGSAYDAANKGYVDGQVSDHTHDLADGE